MVGLLKCNHLNSNIMYELIIHFPDGQDMPVSWEKGAKKVSVKASVAKLLAFRLLLRSRASKKSTALPLRKFTVDFYIRGKKVSAGIEAVQFSPKEHLINDSLNWLIDATYEAAGLEDAKASVGAPELVDVQAN